MPVHVNATHTRKRLREERERLQRIRDGLSTEPLVGAPEREALFELSLADQHPADVGTEMFEREKDASILDRIDAELAEVDRAIKRLNGGTYGVCEACGCPVARSRLQIKPAARFCVNDQARAEREARAG